MLAMSYLENALVNAFSNRSQGPFLTIQIHVLGSVLTGKRMVARPSPARKPLQKPGRPERRQTLLQNHLESASWGRRRLLHRDRRREQSPRLAGCRLVSVGKQIVARAGPGLGRHAASRAQVHRAGLGLGEQEGRF
ncbi:hypothetical protein CMUS01_10778 [Colletotrichum musicola]|uniref:Uncharacterized protein n=1 Tax=Colletotrichum musicola TaxID=2175873 RepID=A0A8H6N7N7_9PEZI|nr:hypothetical protein CMUS01_10778 [Colletotrichum musicola]